MLVTKQIKQILLHQAELGKKGTLVSDLIDDSAGASNDYTANLVTIAAARQVVIV